MKGYSFLTAVGFLASCAGLAWAGHGGGSHGGCGHMLKPVLLLTLAVGYWVLRTARQDPGWLRRVGQVVGWIILLASLCGYLCSLYHTCAGKYCPLSSGSAVCPHSLVTSGGAPEEVSVQIEKKIEKKARP